MAEADGASAPAVAPPVASEDAAVVAVSTPLEPVALAAACRDVEAMLRINPYLYFKQLRATAPGRFHAEFENQSNSQQVVVDFSVIPEPAPGLSLVYDDGLKSRTVFAIEPVPGGGSRLVIMDDYARLPADERQARMAEVDKSLVAWADALGKYFRRLRRWSWLPGWRWYIRRVWVPMKPSARRIVWLIFVITVAEFLFFLFVLLIYLLEIGGGDAT